VHAALLTVFLFALSATAGERTARYWGSQRGNLIRLGLATVLMGLVVWLAFPASVAGSSYGWLFLSGAVGFGFGDIALFLAYVRIGARLTILLNLCTAPLWGACAEFLWLGTRLGPGQLAAGAVILAGVALAILAREPTGRARSGSRAAGIACGLCAGLGQGMGAVITRKAYEAADQLGIALNGFSAAAQRVSGGFVFTLLVVLALWAAGRSLKPAAAAGVSRGVAVAWLLGTTFCGPVFGVSSFQWALALLPSGIVLAVVSTTPIAMLPLARWVDGEKPRALSVAGALVAVAGVVMLLQM
jgi:drug/metabolite transporter (DMT)-like permease